MMFCLHSSIVIIVSYIEKTKRPSTQNDNETNILVQRSIKKYCTQKVSIVYFYLHIKKFLKILLHICFFRKTNYLVWAFVFHFILLLYVVL